MNLFPDKKNVTILPKSTVRFFPKKTLSFLFLLLLLNGSLLGSKNPYTLWGNVKNLNITNSYKNNEFLRSFYDFQAFDNDNAYTLTWHRPNQVPQVGVNFCKNEKPPQKTKNSFRIMSYNVHNFHRICDQEKLAKKMRKNPWYVLEVIRDFDADIVLLQEIAPYAIRIDLERKRMQPGWLEVDFSYFDRLMGNLGFSENIKVNDWEYKKSPLPFSNQPQSIFMGKGVYTGENTIKNVECGNLDGGADEFTRGYIMIVFRYPKSNEKILVYNVHLSFGKDLSLVKKEIKNLIEDVIPPHTKLFETDNVIIMGDFNNSPFMQQNYSIFQPFLKDFVLLNDTTPTAFNQNPFGYTLDLAWVSKPFLNTFKILNPSKNNVYKLVVKSDASDHWPIYIDVALKEKKEKITDTLESSLRLLKAKLLSLAKSLSEKKIKKTEEIDKEKKSIQAPFEGVDFLDVFRESFARQIINKAVLLQQLKIDEKWLKKKAEEYFTQTKEKIKPGFVKKVIEKTEKQETVSTKNDFDDKTKFAYTQSMYHALLFATNTKDAREKYSKIITKKEDDEKKKNSLKNFISLITEDVIKKYYSGTTENRKYVNDDNFYTFVQSKSLKEKITNILFNEELYKNHFVFYHGFKGGLGILYDFINAIDSLYSIEKTEEIIRLRSMLDEYTLYIHIQDLLKDHNPTQIPNLDHNREFKKRVLSANIFLFGNLGLSPMYMGESTFYYFVSSQSIGAITPEAEMRRLFVKYGFDVRKLSALVDLYTKFAEKTGGQLFQIVVNKDNVNDLAYPATPYGAPYKDAEKIKQIFGDLAARKLVFYKKNKDLTMAEFLEACRNDTFDKDNPSSEERRENINTLQTRFLINPAFFLNKEKVKIFRYYAKDVTKEEIEDYQKAFKKNINDFLQDWIFHKKKMLKRKDAPEYPLEKMVRYVKAGTFLKSEFVESVGFNMSDFIKNFKGTNNEMNTWEKQYIPIILAKADFPLEDGMTPLMMACFYKKIALIEKLYELALNHGRAQKLIASNKGLFRDSNGRTTLQIAVEANDEKIAAFLCEKYSQKFPLNTTDASGFSVVSRAIENKNIKILDMILASQGGFRESCKINSMENNTPGNPLIVAVKNFLDANVGINIKNTIEMQIFEKVLNDTTCVPRYIHDNDPEGKHRLIYWILRLDYRFAFYILKAILEKTIANDFFDPTNVVPVDTNSFPLYKRNPKYQKIPFLLYFLADFYLGLREEAFSLAYILAEDKGAEGFFRNFLWIPMYLDISLDVYTCGQSGRSLADEVASCKVLNMHLSGNYIFTVYNNIKQFAGQNSVFDGSNLAMLHYRNNLYFLENLMQEVKNIDENTSSYFAQTFGKQMNFGKSNTYEENKFFIIMASLRRMYDMRINDFSIIDLISNMPKGKESPLKDINSLLDQWTKSGNSVVRYFQEAMYDLARYQKNIDDRNAIEKRNNARIFLKNWVFNMVYYNQYLEAERLVRGANLMFDTYSLQAIAISMKNMEEKYPGLNESNVNQFLNVVSINAYAVSQKINVYTNVWNSIKNILSIAT